MYQTEEAVVQNLKDAGCSEEKIAAFMKEFHGERMKEAVRVLEIQRCSLLEELHASQKKIDCLDYLVYQIEKQKKNREEHLL